MLCQVETYHYAVCNGKNGSCNYRTYSSLGTQYRQNILLDNCGWPHNDRLYKIKYQTSMEIIS